MRRVGLFGHILWVFASFVNIATGESPLLVRLSSKVFCYTAGIE